MKIEVIVNDEGRAHDGLADIRIRTATGPEYGLDLPFRDLYRRCGSSVPNALDLLITASACYVIDKTVSRSSASADWTRELDVSLPVSDPQRWETVSVQLADTLTFLTGDLWRLSFYKSPVPLFQPPNGEAAPKIIAAGAVSLFSGGLDSLAGAIDLLAEDQFGRILLMGHYDSAGPRKAQSELAARLSERYPEKLDILHVRVAHRPAKGVEDSLRSRSFVFLALGLYAAQAFGDQTPLYMFENGLIALNVPLTPSRRGSCSTRTMHPYYLNLMRQTLHALGIINPICNPYALKTKGECVTECKNTDALKALASSSVSCSHGSRRQNWVRKSADNCGYCVPCLFRRAALYKAGLDSGQQYGLDVLTGELNANDELESADDLRAVVDFLRTPITKDRLRKILVATASLPNLDDHAQLTCRGFEEVKTWLQGHSEIKSLAEAISHA